MIGLLKIYITPHRLFCVPRVENLYLLFACFFPSAAASGSLLFSRSCWFKLLLCAAQWPWLVCKPCHGASPRPRPTRVAERSFWHLRRLFCLQSRGSAQICWPLRRSWIHPTAPSLRVKNVSYKSCCAPWRKRSRPGKKIGEDRARTTPDCTFS